MTHFFLWPWPITSENLGTIHLGVQKLSSGNHNGGKKIFWQSSDKTIRLPSRWECLMIWAVMSLIGLAAEFNYNYHYKLPERCFIFVLLKGLPIFWSFITTDGPFDFHLLLLQQINYTYIPMCLSHFQLYLLVGYLYSLWPFTPFCGQLITYLLHSARIIRCVSKR